MTTSPNYLRWVDDNATPFTCEVGEFKGFDDDDVSAMWKGKSLKDKFDANAEFRMDPDYPDNTVLAETLNNIQSLIIGSERLKQFLEEQNIRDIEYLPVTIRDHKGKKAARYYVTNPLVVLDCINHKASGSVFGRTNPNRVRRLRNLVLLEDKLKPDVSIFRTLNYPDAILVREDLAKAIGKNFPGIKFKKLPPKKK